MIAAVFIWGSTFVITKSVLDELGPFCLAALRFGLATILLMPANINGFTEYRAQLRQLAMAGFLGVSLFVGLQNLGLRYTSAASAGLILGSIPAFTLAISAVVLREPLFASRMLGVLASISGTALVVLGNKGKTSASSFVGDVLVLSAAICWAVYTVKSKALAGRVPQSLLTASNMGFGFLFLLPASILEAAIQGFHIPPIKTWLAIAYLGAVASGAAYSLWNYGLKTVSAAEAGIITNLTTLVAVLAAALVGERITLPQAVGGVLIMAGVCLASMPVTEAQSKGEMDK